MSQRVVRSVAVALVLGALGPAASPLRADLIVLDFPELNPQDQDVLVIPPLYESQGFILMATLGFNTYGTGATNFYMGEKSLAPIAPTDPGQVSDIVLTWTGGGPFDLLSIDLARNFAFDTAPTVTFTGTLAGGGTVSETFTVTLDPPERDFQTFTFTPEFTGLTQVSWSQPAFPPPQGQGLHQFTDITLQAPSAPVPEPSGLVLAGIAALGGLLLGRRRREKTAL